VSPGPGARRQEPLRHDGSIFASAANQNPTWTILALAMRRSQYLVDDMKRGMSEPWARAGNEYYQ